MLTRYGSFLYRARWGVLLAWLLLLVGAGVFGVGVFGRLQSSGAVDPNSQSSKAEQLLNTRLNSASTDVVILLQSSTFLATDPVFAQEENDLLTKLRQRSEVTTVTSYYSWHSQDFISKDGHETFITLQLTGQDFTSKQNEYQALQPLLTEPDLHIGTTGNVPVTMAFNQQIGQDLGRAEAFTFPILAVLLLLVFSSVVAAGLPLLIGSVAILGAFAILDALTLFTDIASYVINIVTMLGLGLAIDYALFLVTRFREELVLNGNRVPSALEKTMATAGRTVIFSALTVSSGLISLLLFPLPFLRSIGEGAIVSILVVLLASLTLLPALLAILGKRVNALSLQRLFRRSTRSTRTRTEQRGGWYRLSETIMRWPVPVALVDGSTPLLMDLLSSMDTTLPFAFAMIIVAIFVLLFLMTGSLVLPLKVILLNILSLSATFGGLVWIFQDGHLQNLLNFSTTSGIDSSMPALIFTIAFGLSMDYEVFLLSRIKEHFDRTGDNRKAISTGLQQTGWLITSAAILFTVVAGAFGTSKIISIQEIGVGLAIAVIIDATLVRMLLVPAAMRLLGELNWWAPAPLHRLWQSIGFTEAANEPIEASEETPSVLTEHSAKIEA